MGMCRLLLVAAMCWGTLQAARGVDTDACPMNGSATCRYIEGRCICVLDSSMTGDFYASAEAYCAHMVGGSVASLHSEEENNVLVDLIANSSTAVWLGIRGGGGDRPTYSWIDGTAVDYLNVMNDTQEDKDSCHIMKPGDGQWWPQSCNANHGISCTYPYTIPSSWTSDTTESTRSTAIPSTLTSETTERTSSLGYETTTAYSPCYDGCQVVNLSCLCVLRGPGNYPMMDKMCVVRFGTGVPASIMNRAENDIIMSMIQDIPGGVWIGLRWDSYSYVWDGVENASYLNLANSSSHGGAYRMSSTDGKWYPADSMKDELGAACRYEPDPPITPPPYTTPASTLVPTPPRVPSGGPSVTTVVIAVVVTVVVVTLTVLLGVIFVRRRRRKRLEDYANLTSHVDI